MTVLAVGVDAPLWWSSGKNSDRAADQYLRQRFNISGGTVQAANSLSGAIAARKGSVGRRTRDLLFCKRLNGEQDPAAVPWGPARDWGPEGVVEHG